MSKLTSTITLYGHKGNIAIDFYQNNNMPALILIDEDHHFLLDLTTNIRDYEDKTISIRSDESAIADALIKAGWIKDKPIVKLPSGFIYIHYYPLTDSALEKITKEAESLGIII